MRAENSDDLAELNELLEGDWGGGRVGEGNRGGEGFPPPGPGRGPQSKDRRVLVTVGAMASAEAPSIASSGGGNLSPQGLSLECAEQGSVAGITPSHPRGAGAPAWSLLIPLPAWQFLSRLEFYEGDETLPNRERLFHQWWLARRIPVARAVAVSFTTISGPIVALYFWISASYSVRARGG